MNSTTHDEKRIISQKSAVRFVIFIGIVSLFADMTYQGARSIIGPYFVILGASATAVGFVSGFGELVGYALRIVSGYWVDRTAHYWLITLLGYVLNLLAIPALALTGYWPVAAALIILERTGKAIRTPARDAMLSYASHKMGMGWGFGLHQSMDQIGSMLGPIVITIVLFFHGGYRESFAVLFIPALLALAVLLTARKFYPNPQDLEVKTVELRSAGIPKLFWFYLVGAALIAAGYADFPLIAYHFEKAKIIPEIWIPVAYAVAMGVGAIASLTFGYIYDRLGIATLIITTLLSTLAVPLAFLGNAAMVFVGMIFWGIGMGTQSSLMRSVIGDMIPKNKRGAAFGIFNSIFGLAWFLGSVLIGMLYDISLTGLILFSVIAQLAAIPIFMITAQLIKNTPNT